jgi:hypothetical protein
MRTYQVVLRREGLEAFLDHAAAGLVLDEHQQVEFPHAGEATDEPLDFFESPIYSGNQILEDVRPDDHKLEQEIRKIVLYWRIAPCVSTCN